VDTGRCKPANISTALLVTNASITQLKEYLKQCDKFYPEIVFNLSKKLHKVVGIFSGFIETVELCSETVEVL